MDIDSAIYLAERGLVYVPSEDQTLKSVSSARSHDQNIHKTLQRALHKYAQIKPRGNKNIIVYENDPSSTKSYTVFPSGKVHIYEEIPFQRRPAEFLDSNARVAIKGRMTGSKKWSGVKALFVRVFGRKRRSYEIDEEKMTKF